MPRHAKQLTPEQNRSAVYFNQLLLRWKSHDPVARARVSNAALAAMISEHFTRPSKKVTGAGVGLWITGDSIPNEDSSYAIARFFDADLEETFAAFGHEYKPPMTLQSFYEHVKEVAYQEQWTDADLIVSRLKKASIWDHHDSRWIEVAFTILNSNNPLYDKANQIAYIIEVEERNQFLKEVLAERR
jgi:hypothetical protein